MTKKKSSDHAAGGLQPRRQQQHNPDHLVTSHAALTGRDRGFWRSREYSFRVALAGAMHTLRTQPNAWIEVSAGLIVAIMGWLFTITAMEWGILGLTIFGVLALETVNTAVEAVVDLVSPDFHPLAKLAKDTAAGAMIFVTLGSICIALGIFGPRILVLFFG